MLFIRRFIIRSHDFLLSMFIFALIIIPCAFIAAAIFFEDFGPVFFKQTRVGKNGKHFKIFKFRTMRVAKDNSGTGELSEASIDLKKARAAFQTTKANDPRITKVGKVLRKFHFDELPQFVNVMIGDMSIVGVRPDTPVQEADYSAEYWIRRQSLRPGITGPAQITSNTNTMQKRTELDLSWLDNPSVYAYYSSVFKTITKVLNRSGN